MTYLPGATADPDLTVFGALAPVLAEPGVSDVVVNGEELWVDRGNGCERLQLWLGEPASDIARRLIESGGRHIDEVSPIADVRLGHTRVHAVLAPVASPAPLLSIRVIRPTALSLDELERSGSFSASQAARLRAAVASGTNLLISGGTGTGKTTVLRALLALVPEQARIITIEDLAELGVSHPHAISLEARQHNIEGSGAIDLAELVRAALRMRPDWLVLGECRGREIAEFLSALNTGHSGGGTLHANTLADVPARLEGLGAIAGLSDAALARQAASAIGLIVHLERRDGVRRCSGIAALHLRDGRLSIEVEP